MNKAAQGDAFASMQLDPEHPARVRIHAEGDWKRRFEPGATRICYSRADLREVIAECRAQNRPYDIV